jgi:DNA topoisomerase-3
LAKALVITEKPSVARDIVDVLGGFTEHDGYFESDSHIVTFAVGHLFELLAPEEIDDKYKRWTLDALPIIPSEFRLKPKKGQRERIRTIEKLLRRRDVEEVVNACDAGREGELIFREIIEHFACEKPIRRLWLQSMTDRAVREGFERLRSGEELQGLAAAAACRARSDWLIGMNATRALTKRLKSRKERTAWSAGRVQTPTLAMLVDREFEILAHRPKLYWRAIATFEHDGHAYTGTWFDPDFESGGDRDLRDDRLFDRARAEGVVAAVNGRTGAASESRKPSRESAPPLFDLTSLQREANRRFGWSARRTLSAAQRCYERHKILTYPRTDSRCLPEDYRAIVDDVLAAYAAAADRTGAEFGEYAAAAAQLRRKGLVNEARTFDDANVSEHFAIIPTGTFPSRALSGDDKRLYDLVVRRFLGNFYPPALWERLERLTEVGGEHFRTRARSLKQKGWRAVLPPANGEGDAVLPPLSASGDGAEGVRVRVAAAELVEEQTQPPARITEARLLSLMENAGKQIEDDELSAMLDDKGIGTPATRADVIENLIAKGYVVRVGKALRPSVKGIRLIDTLHRINIKRLTSPELTGELEQHLLDVEHGIRKAEDFMNEIQEYANAIVETTKTFEYDELYDVNEPLGPCPACGRPVIEMAWFYRCREVPGVDRDGDCPMRFWKDTSGRYLDRDAVKTLLEDGHTGDLDGFTARNGRTYRGVIEIDRDEWKLKVSSLGWNEGEGIRDEPEYDVNPDPLGPCRCEQESAVVETPTHYICQRKAEEDLRAKDLKRRRQEWKKEGKSPKQIRAMVAEIRSDDPPPSCGFILPRTVCKREMTREEAEVYLRNGRTDLLEDFTSRFGRPFSATLVLKENGRHGFEFPPRRARGRAVENDDFESSPARPAGRRKKAAKKKPAKKKTAAKKKASKKPAAGKSGGKKTARKKPARKKPARKKPARKKPARKKPAATKKAAAK